LVDLAERAYELEHGALPKNIRDLVPDYLKAVPQDPANPTKAIELPAPAGREGGTRKSG
jgi:hypothetical protein